MRTEWGTTEDSTAEVRGKGRFGIADIDDHAIVINGPLGTSVVVEGTPEQLMKWALDLVASVAKATGQEPDAPAGSTVWILRNRDDVFAYGSREARTKHEAEIARADWGRVVGVRLPAGQFDVDKVPDEPPADDAAAAEMFWEAMEMRGDGYHVETDALTVED